ncbi:MAG: hypothetical protein IJW44_03860, partial [Clostridia bacterium]|nr:hypothetical protein [Clostridia bacterium]
IPSMSYGYSTLIDCAVAENLSDILELLLDHALNYTKQLKTFLENHIFDFESDLYDPYTENNLEHILCFKKERRKKCWCVVPYVQNCLNISNMFLRKKAQEINCFFDTLR